MRDYRSITPQMRAALATVEHIKQGVKIEITSE
jgi:hypothetical protein